MYSLGGKVLDILDDVNLKVLAGSRYFEKVGSLPVTDPSVIDDLDDRSFGVVFITKKGEQIRKYPLHDYPNTVLSNIYFDLTSDKLPPEAKVAAATQIREACQLHGLPMTPAVAKYAADGSLAGQNYVDLTAVYDEPINPGAPKFSLSQLVDSYVENREKYGREDRMKLAQAMAPMSEKAGFDMPEDLRPFAIKDPVVDQEALFAQCALRKQALLGHHEAHRLLDEFIEKRATFEPDEVVTLLETFDRQYGLDGHWERGLEPRMVLAEKKAMHDVATAASPFPHFTDDELKGFVASHGSSLEMMFGKDFAAKVKEDPKKIWSLPTTSQRFIAARIEKTRENHPAKAT